MRKDLNKSLIESIPVPTSLTQKQVTIAQNYAKAKMEGTSITQFCTDNGISTKSYYAWVNDNDDFKKYLHDVQSATIPDDERQAFQQLKKHLLKIPYKSNPTPKEIELFMDVFKYVAEADKQERMQELGISNISKPHAEKTVDERKKALLSRLKLQPNKKGE